jgi:hypothetical protein
MRGFTSPTQAQRFLTFHGLTQNLFDLAAISCRRSTIGSYVRRRSKFGRTSYVHEGWCRPSANTSDILCSRLT